MSAPSYVPRPKDDRPRVYESPPWRPEAWFADRPAELAGQQPTGGALGHPGPDQGFALKLARRFEGRLTLAEGEHERDAMAGCTAVAMRRASMFGRGPSIHDLTVAFTAWGFTGPAAPGLVAMRRTHFIEVAHPHHYLQLRMLVDRLPGWLLCRSPDQVRELAGRDWQACFGPEPMG